VCTGAALPPFNNAGLFTPSDFVKAEHLIVLPDGNVLLEDAHRLRRFDAAGNLLRTDLIGRMRSIALSANGTHLLVAHGCDEEVHEHDLATMTDLRTMVPIFVTANITMVSPTAWTAALGPSVATEAVPALSPMLLGALAVLIAFAALLRMR
jgi:hypothetical protein